MALGRARVCMQDMTGAHEKTQCKEENGTFDVYCSYVVVCNQYFRI